MTDPKSSLLALRFTPATARLLRRRLFADYVVELAPERRRWTADTDVYFYVKSKRFSAVMNRLFRGAEFPFRSYVDRKLRQDESGTLAMVLAAVERTDVSFSFMSANIYVTPERLGVLLDQMSSPQGVHDVLFESEMGRFIAMIEGAWVYLYLAAERGLGPPEILAELAGNPKLPPHIRSWRLQRPIDHEVIEEFLREFRAVAASSA
jgi:hypothetical protein